MKNAISSILATLLLSSAANAGVVWSHDFTGPDFSDGQLSGQNGFVGHPGPQVDISGGGATTITGSWLGNSKGGSGALSPGDWLELEVNLSSSMAFNDPGAATNLGNADIIRVGFTDTTQTFPGSATSGVSGKIRFAQWYNAGSNNNSGALTVSSNAVDTSNTGTGRLLGAAEDIGIHGQAGASQDLTFDSLKLTYRATMTNTVGEWDLSLNLFNNTTAMDFGTHTYTAVSAPDFYTAASAGDLRAGFRTFDASRLDGTGVIIENATFTQSIPEPGSSILLTLATGGLLMRRRR